MSIKIAEHHGNKIIILENNYGISIGFGVVKAKLILDYIKEIRKFVKKYDKKNKE